MRRIGMCSYIVALLALGACTPSGSGIAAPAAPHAPPTTIASAPVRRDAGEKLAAETPITTASGATFTASKGWFMTKASDRVVLEDPEKSVRITFLEEAAPTAELAIAQAWKRVDPTFARTPRETTKPPARDGWDEIAQTRYETRDEEARVIIALAQRKGGTHHVALLDGSRAGFDKRGAQLMTAVLSYRAKGLETESFAGRPAKKLDAEAIRALEAFVEEARVKAKLPGLALAVVQDGRVVLERGFGVTEQGKSKPVTPKTLFMIGSTTKSLTTLLMARLVDADKLAWDTPLTRVLPNFALGDPEITRQITVRHTVCACTGMPRRDWEFIFEYAGVSAEARLASMRDMKPTTGFGETFQYSNLLVAAGGYAAAHAAVPNAKLDVAYRDALRAHVLGPLGMTATTSSFDEVRRAEHATPHGETKAGQLAPMPLVMEEGVGSVAPAGALWSNLRDMEKVLFVELANGVLPSGARFVSESTLLERRKPQVKITDEKSYGLGLFVDDDHGVRVVGHGGNNLGFTSDMFFLPVHGTGVVLLSNGSGTANVVRTVVRRRLLEILFDGKAEATRSLDFGLAYMAEAREKQARKIQAAPDPTWAARWVGSYRSPELGAVKLRREGSNFVLDVGEWTSTLGQKDEDDGTKKWTLLDAPWGGELELAAKEIDGKPTLSLEAPQHNYVFEATGAPRAK